MKTTNLTYSVTEKLFNILYFGSKGKRLSFFGVLMHGNNTRIIYTMKRYYTTK